MQIQTQIGLPPAKPAEPNRAPRAAYLVFHPSRSSLSSLQKQEGPYRFTSLRELKPDLPEGRYSNVLALAFDKGATESFAPLHVTSHNGPLQLGKVVYELEDGSTLVAAGSEATPCVDAQATLTRGRPLAEELYDFEDYLSVVDEALKPSAGDPEAELEKKRYQRFFFDLDRSTEPTLRGTHLAGENTLRTIEQHYPWVMTGLQARMEARLASPKTPAPVLEEELFGVAFRWMAEFLSALLHEHFPSLTRGDPADVDRAFLMFANGELRRFLPTLGLWTTQPSSGSYFYFGEFGLSLEGLDRVTDRETWSLATNAMVRSQDLFRSAYQPSTASPRFSDYTAASFRGSAAKARLPGSALPLEQIAAENVARAFPGGL